MSEGGESDDEGELYEDEGQQDEDEEEDSSEGEHDSDSSDDITVDDIFRQAKAQKSSSKKKAAGKPKEVHQRGRAPNKASVSHDTQIQEWR
jgi:hypothetical protein